MKLAAMLNCAEVYDRLFLGKMYHSKRLKDRIVSKAVQKQTMNTKLNFSAIWLSAFMHNI